MSVTVTETGYSVTGGITIIPNPAFEITSIILESHDEQKKLCEINGIEYTDSIKWINILAYDIDCSDGGFTNYARHGIWLNNDIYLDQFPSHLPDTILKNIKEGSLLSFKAELTEIDCTKNEPPPNR
jgi:hypothetical protein